MSSSIEYNKIQMVNSTISNYLHIVYTHSLKFYGLIVPISSTQLHGIVDIIRLISCGW